MKLKHRILLIVVLAAGVILANCAERCHEDEADLSAGQTSPSASGNNPDAGAKPSEGDSSTHYPDLEIAATPAGIPSILKHYEGFTVGFNPENHTPNWVGWELLASETDGESSRNNAFWCDDELEGCAYPYDYTRSGYDRGHLCPAADQKWSDRAMRDCFVMANMCPQDHSLNSGAWATLEKKERLWAKRDSALIIVAGPIYEKTDNKRIGDSGVRVPSAFFKVLAAPYCSSPRAIAFVYPNMSAPGNMSNYVMTVDEVEQLTGFDFFSSLPDQLENRIEATTSFKEWDR